MSLEEFRHGTPEPARTGSNSEAEGATRLADWTPGWRQMLRHSVIRIVIASFVIIGSMTLAQSGLHTLRELLPLPVYYGLFAGGSIVVRLATYYAYAINSTTTL